MLVFAIKTPAGYSLHKDGYWKCEGATPEQHEDAIRQLKSIFRADIICDYKDYLIVQHVMLIEGKNTPPVG